MTALQRLIRTLVRVGWPDVAIRALLHRANRAAIDREIRDARGTEPDDQ